MSEEREPKEAGEKVPEDVPAEKPKKRKARAEGKEEGSSTAVIRDRNQRIREEAAAKRRTRREGERKPASAQSLDATEIMDDAFARGTHAVAGWLKRNINVIQWVVVLGVAGGIGWQIYKHRRVSTDAKATDSLMAAVAAENGRVGDSSPGPDPRSGLSDERPHFKDDAARLAAAASAYRAATGNDTIRGLARLGLAGVLFDQGKYKDALTEYQAVRTSPLAGEDGDVKGRSLEGIGLSEESLKNPEGALKAFRELGNLESPGFGALGLYHQARVEKERGNAEKAKEHLKAVLKKLEKPANSERTPSYLEEAARDLLESIDPKAVPPRPGALSPQALQQLAGQTPDGTGEQQLSPEKLNELLKQLASAMPAGSGAPPPAPSSQP